MHRRNATGGWFEKRLIYDRPHLRSLKFKQRVDGYNKHSLSLLNECEFDLMLFGKRTTIGGSRVNGHEENQYNPKAETVSEIKTIYTPMRRRETKDRKIGHSDKNKATGICILVDKKRTEKLLEQRDNTDSSKLHSLA
ncbi:hypothetical protein V1478_013031 [Vespula squamosa]|uniref:Uncharacterized protein n=1 Tax=Vespula squamosa TaxID=30214 RepID=A0ABD2A9P8_VESSQ